MNSFLYSFNDNITTPAVMEINLDHVDAANIAKAVAVYTIERTQAHSTNPNPNKWLGVFDKKFMYFLAITQPSLVLAKQINNKMLVESAKPNLHESIDWIFDYKEFQGFNGIDTDAQTMMSLAIRLVTKLLTQNNHHRKNYIYGQNILLIALLRTLNFHDIQFAWPTPDVMEEYGQDVYKCCRFSSPSVRMTLEPGFKAFLYSTFFAMSNQ